MKVHGPVTQNQPISPTDPLFRVVLILITVKHDLTCRKLFLKTSLSGVFWGDYNKSLALSSMLRWSLDGTNNDNLLSTVV